MQINLISYTPNAIEALQSSIGNCYDKKVGEKGIEHCIKSGHHSVLEFVDFHFHIEGVSRALLAQLTRHRMASYAVRSQRYCVEDGFNFITPDSVYCNQNHPELLGEYLEIMDRIRYFYEHMVKKGIPAEDARYILPNATETIIDMKINLRSLLNFMNLRLCTRSQWEIRELANRMRDEISLIYPIFSTYMEPKCVSMGWCNETKSCGYFANREG